ncbi:13196_t:CDS:2, partial [Dentiscutata heterogama]
TILKQTLTTAQKTKFNMLVAEWIISDTLPFSIVSSQSFAAMIRYLNISMYVPSRDIIKSIIQKAFAVMKKDIQSLLEQISSNEIDTKLHSVLAAFNITNKLLCATTNGGSNDNLILNNYNFHFQSHRCLAHVLNIIVTTGLSPIKQLIEKVCNFVNVISSSSSITQEFKELGQSVGEGEATCKILQDVSTR